MSVRIVHTEKVYNSRFLNMFLRTFEKDGSEGKWLFSSRDQDPPPHEEKKPDAVIVVPVLLGDGEPKILLTSEYRVPIGVREMSFPAGLVDEGDYEGTNSRGALLKAAVRECWEETNTVLEPKVVSPPLLYTSAGMTNEACGFVFGTCTGEPSDKNSEKSEDIEVITLGIEDIRALLAGKGPYYDHGLSVRAWMMLQPILDHGWPDWIKGETLA